MRPNCPLLHKKNLKASNISKTIFFAFRVELNNQLLQGKGKLHSLADPLAQRRFEAHQVKKPSLKNSHVASKDRIIRLLSVMYGIIFYSNL